MSTRLSAIVLVAMLAAGRPAAAATPLEAFFEKHCYSCHSGRDPEAGLDLAVESRDFSRPEVVRRFTRIHDRIARGEMPPADAERPPAAELRAVTTWLDESLTQADARRIAAAGRARMRRLTRAEYEHTLRDLLALPRLDIREMLPADGRVAGFEKIADGLDLSPVHLAAYAAAAERALDAAIATRSVPPPVFRRRIHPAGLFKFHGNLTQGNFVLLKDRQPDPALPPRGGFEEISGYINKPGSDADMPDRERFYKDNKISESRSSVGLLVPNLAGYEAAMNVAPIYAGFYRMRLSVWGFHWNKGRVEPVAASQAAVLRAHEEGHQQEGGRLLGTFTAASLEPREHEITAWLDPLESIVFDPVSLFWRGLQVRQVGGRTAGFVGDGVALDWFEIEGPLFETWPSESHRRLFGDLPIRALETGTALGATSPLPPQRRPVRGLGGYLPNFYVDIPPAERKPPLETVTSPAPLDDARRLLAAFLPRAFRRPVAADEIEPYVALVSKRLADRDCFEDAMRRTYVAVLTSPELLFHPADRDADAAALAARLSYWLWNSPPDEPLLAAARSLRDPAVLHAQVDRLLADPRSDRFIEDFTNQWLELHRLEETNPDKQLYPEYRFLLHEGIAAEPRAFLRELIDRDLPIRMLVDADFTMLTQRLAEHYGIPGVDGVEVRRVPLPPGSHRGGVLSQAAIHKVTANGTTTTPVKRGVWVIDRLFDDPAPPPPPGIAGIDPDTRGATTIREQLAKHRDNAGCAVCHAKIDPPGFALECFDPIGGYRDRYRSTGQGDPAPETARIAWMARYRLGPPVDASGTLGDGRRFSGIDELKSLLAAEPRPLARAFTAHLTRYATGADIGYADRRTIAAVVESAAATQFGVRSLIHALAASPLVIPPREPATRP